MNPFSLVHLALITSVLGFSNVAVAEEQVQATFGPVPEAQRVVSSHGYVANDYPVCESYFLFNYN